jgi:hypothetical protein
VYRQRPCDELINRPRSPIDCLRSRVKAQIGAVALKKKNYILTVWSRVVLEKIIVAQTVKKFSDFN